MAATQRVHSDPVPTSEIFGKTIDTDDQTLTIPIISYGLPFDQAVLKHTTHDDRIFVLVSKTLSEKTDNFTKLKKALGDRIVGEQIGMTSHTMFGECQKVTEAARKANANTILTLGAGSLADAAKFVRDALTNKFDTVEDLARAAEAHPGRRKSDDPSTWIDDGRKSPTGKLILIPTSLSGGEHTESAGVTDEKTQRKYQIFSKHSDVTILDPVLCLSTPLNIWLQSGVRGIDHCVETMLSVKPNADASEAAAKGLALLVPGLLACKYDAEAKDAQARLNAQVGVALAILGITVWRVPCGASHAIGHMLGPMGMNHGETSCILLPAVCAYNAQVEKNRERQMRVAEILWEVPICKELFERKGLDQSGSQLADLLDVVIRELGMPRTLKEKNIEGARVRDLAEMSMNDFWTSTNPRPLDSADDVMSLLETVRG